MKRLRIFVLFWALVGLVPVAVSVADTGGLDVEAISKAAGTQATVKADGTVRIGWSRTDVPLSVDGLKFPPAAGLGSWAAFKSLPAGGGHGLPGR